MDRIKELLVNHFKPRPPVTAEQHAFHKRDQCIGEMVSEFIIELRHLVRTCSFGNFLEETPRDCLVCGLAHSGIRKKPLTEKDLILQKAIEMATAVEMAVLQDTQPTTMQESEEVHRLDHEK